MLKGLVLTLFILFFGGLSFGQDQNLKERYEARKLTIAPNFRGPDSFEWEATEGFKPIDEPHLLSLAGLKEEADKASGNQFLRNSLTWGGFAGMLGGLTLEFMSLFNHNDLNGVFLGAGIAGVSCIPALLGAGMPPNITPLGRVRQIADDYNERLLDQLHSQQP